MRKMFAAAFALLFFAELPGAAKLFDDGPVKLAPEFTAPDLSSPVPVPGSPVRDEKEWTVMVYINAKNDLEEFGLADLAEMERVGSTDKVNIVVEIGRMEGFDSSAGNWTGVRRYLVQKGHGASTLVEDFKADMGDWRELARFGRWAIERYPARKHMLVVWDHGSGWRKTVALRKDRGISYDSETGSHISTAQLAAALKEIGRVELLAFDACLMQMAEVVHEIKDYAEYIAGSEETVPADGYAYDMFLADLVKEPGMTAGRLADALFETYLVYCGFYNYKATQSLLRTSSFAEFLPLVNDWADGVIASGEKELVARAAAAAQKYYYWDNKDLYHFVQLVTEGSADSGTIAKGKALMRLISGEMVLRNGYTKNGSANSYGLAVYLPSQGEYDRNYEQLAWAGDSRWDEFIRWYMK